MKKRAFFGLLAMALAFGLIGCGGDPTHTHDFSGGWKSDAAQHWKECPDDGVKAQTANHTPADGICTVCGYNNMVRINAGTFQMGSPDSEANHQADETQHEVTLTQGFYMGKYQVTQKQWETVMGKTITEQQALATTSTTDYGRGDAYPIYYVSWYDALVFCNKLSVKEGLTPAYSIDGETDPDEWGDVPTTSDDTWNAVSIVANSNGYRLPTEAQWEYACRAGTTTAYNTGATISDDTGWYTDNSGSKTHEVGKKPPNDWGLYDMHGNVFEWCWDWYDTYASGAQSDPLGASSGSDRVLRGGGWGDSAAGVRSARRGSGTPSSRYHYIGFRLLRP